MADESEELAQGDIISDSMEAQLAASSIGPLRQQIEGAIQTVVDHPSPRLTNMFNRGEPRLYARMTYSERLKHAVRQADSDQVDEDGKPTGLKIGFVFPNMEEYLMKPDRDYRTSVKQQTRKIIESMTHIFEKGGDSGRRGGFFSRRR